MRLYQKLIFSNEEIVYQHIFNIVDLNNGLKNN